MCVYKVGSGRGKWNPKWERNLLIIVTPVHPPPKKTSITSIRLIISFQLKVTYHLFAKTCLICRELSMLGGARTAISQSKVLRCFRNGTNFLASRGKFARQINIFKNIVMISVEGRWRQFAPGPLCRMLFAHSLHYQLFPLFKHMVIHDIMIVWADACVYVAKHRFNRPSTYPLSEGSTWTRVNEAVDLQGKWIWWQK